MTRRDPTTHVEQLRELSDQESFFEPISTLRRRTVIRYMNRLSPTASVSTKELARVCASIEQNEPLSALARSDFRRSVQGLRQRDVTRLSIAGVLDTQNTDSIVRGERFELYADVLTAIDAKLQ
ncbi:DUF7344 domain-containing protein [Halocatena pleomorpha]|uniref:DUF7344 domain-containing protein n=1 Tax=Halocatena pleomorpha TaxID=1785090 RepID=A0A3P3RMH6_9EURY|nr:hypothetical protein [Halocatena pleomorpha]RRJ33593.1 hypothetical protein EIK79_02000 [Halocatena pleomorpha]